MQELEKQGTLESDPTETGHPNFSPWILMLGTTWKLLFYTPK